MSVFKVMNDDEIRDFCIKKDFKIFKLEQQLQQKENIIKEVREYIETQIPIVKAEMGIPNINTSTSELLNYEKILEIIDKVMINNEIK